MEGGDGEGAGRLVVRKRGSPAGLDGLRQVSRRRKGWVGGRRRAAGHIALGAVAAHVVDLPGTFLSGRESSRLVIVVEAIREALAALPVPEGVVSGWDVESGLDSAGDKAVWVYVVVVDDRVDDIWDGWDDLRYRIHGIVAEQLGDEVAAYVRMRTRSEVEGGRAAAQ